MSPTGPFSGKGTRTGGQNRRVALGLSLFAALMVGLSFAAVPLYRIFCAATGYAGTPQRAAQRSTKAVGETLTVHFDANVAPGLPWSFEPVEHEITLHIGENRLAFFRAVNLSKEPITGSAVFNVSPEIMGQYFTKVQCFCFTEQTLKPGQQIELPVSFFVDPKIVMDRDAKNVRDMVLSYTFHRVRTPPDAHAEASPAKPKNPS